MVTANTNILNINKHIMPLLIKSSETIEHIAVLMPIVDKRTILL